MNNLFNNKIINNNNKDIRIIIMKGKEKLMTMNRIIAITIIILKIICELHLSMKINI